MRRIRVAPGKDREAVGGRGRGRDSGEGRGGTQMVAHVGGRGYGRGNRVQELVEGGGPGGGIAGVEREIEVGKGQTGIEDGFGIERLGEEREVFRREVAVEDRERGGGVQNPAEFHEAGEEDERAEGAHQEEQDQQEREPRGTEETGAASGVSGGDAQDFAGVVRRS